MSLLRVINAAMALLGVSAIVIGILIYTIGPSGTANAFSSVFQRLGFNPIYTSGLEDINTDSEMRFFSVFWCAFGLWILGHLRHPTPSRSWVVWALGLFWAGGCARLLSYWQTGAWPDPLFVALTWIELIIPPLLLALHLKERATAQDTP